MKVVNGEENKKDPQELIKSIKTKHTWICSLLVPLFSSARMEIKLDTNTR
tara:strand:- start:67 stop:216 length:150 start_codon:yes stop_codon:yes gene_type:complete